MFVVGFLRSIVIFFDFDEKRKRQTLAENIVLLTFSTVAVIFTVLIHNLIISNYWVMLIECNIAFLSIYWGSLRLSIENQMLEYFKNNLRNQITTILMCVISAFILKHIVDTLKNDTIKELL